MCGVVGLKTTYGLVSRYGLIAFACSLEQIGPLTKDVEDCALFLSEIAGHDPKDSTTLKVESGDYSESLKGDVKGIRIGVLKEFFGEGTDEIVAKSVWNGIHALESLGVSYEEVSLAHIKYSIPTYFIIAMSEASSNLARYDGMRYGLRAKTIGDWNEVFSESRREGFGQEVTRRIMLGTYALTAGYFDLYYLKALKIRTLIKQDFERAFNNFDILIGPTSPVLAFKIGERTVDPLQMYMADMDTAAINLAGIPALSIPCGYHDNLPIGIQIMGSFLKEDIILNVAYAFEREVLKAKIKPPI